MNIYDRKSTTKYTGSSPTTEYTRWYRLTRLSSLAAPKRPAPTPSGNNEHRQSANSLRGSSPRIISGPQIDSLDVVGLTAHLAFYVDEQAKRPSTY